MWELFRAIPSIDKCIKALLKADPDLKDAPPALLNSLANSWWDKKREEIRKGKCTEKPDLERDLPYLLKFVRKALKPNLKPLINGTGVIIHTNLGRSVLAKEASEAVCEIARSYCSLEMDLESGERGSRHDLTRELVHKLTGAEDSLIVNNNAAAVLLVLDTLCQGGETIVSRGELVEIGGSFRIPDIMLKSGTVLKEVGTTNRTHLEDYRDAINEKSRAIMRVHASNFRITGFHKSVDLKDLANLAHEHGLPLIFDLGSGNLLDFSEYGLPGEPTVREILNAGADCVCFSGDKALGGPQAGIIAGKSSLIERFKKNPLVRALRCGKLNLAALEATLRLYLDPKQAIESVPTAKMMLMTRESLARKARSLANLLRRSFSSAGIDCTVKVEKDTSRIGGGAYPECDLPTSLVCLYPANISAQELRMRLLKGNPPLIGRLENDAFRIDPRTLDRKDYHAIATVITQAIKRD